MATGRWEPLVDTVFLESCFRTLNIMQESKEFCDVTLIVEGREFHAHKVILMSSSEYFRKLFNDKFMEGSQERIELKDIEAETMAVILEYIYSGRLNLCNSNVGEVLRTTDYFQLERARPICSEYLLATVNVETCVNSYILGEIYNFQELVNCSKEIIARNIVEISGKPDFLELGLESIELFLINDKIHLNGELLFKIIMDWIKYDLKNRKPCIFSLLKLVRVDNVSLEFFTTHIKNEKLLRDDINCSNWLVENLFEKCGAILNYTDWLDNSLFITNRMGDDLSSYKYQIGTKTSYRLSPRPPISFFSTLYYKNTIYIAGGLDNENMRQSTLSFQYDRIDNRWSEINFKLPRSNSGSCVLNDKWYVLGGHDEAGPQTASAIVYDFYSGQTRYEAEMNRRRKLPGAAIYQGSVYACCGWTGRNDSDSVERYDPREGKWNEICNFNTLNGCCTAVVVADYLYGLRLFTNTVERLDLRNYQSFVIPSKDIVATANCWLTSNNGRLFVAHDGGILEYANYVWNDVFTMDLMHPAVITCV